MPDDAINGLLTMTVWAMRSKDAPKIKKAFELAVSEIETKGVVSTVELCDRYVGEFVKLGYEAEADKMRRLADQLRGKWSDSFAQDGHKLQWWETELWQSKLDQLPVEFRSSRAINSHPGLFLFTTVIVYYIGVRFAVPALDAMFNAVGLKLPELLLYVFVLSGITGGFIVSRNYERSRKQRGAASWCKLSRDGVEFSEPNNRVKLLWSEVASVNERDEDDDRKGVTHIAVEIIGTEGKKFRMSAKYFQDEEVRLVTAVGLLQTRRHKH